MERLKGAAYTKAPSDDGCDAHCYRNKDNRIFPKDARHPPLQAWQTAPDQPNEPRTLKNLRNLLKANK